MSQTTVTEDVPHARAIGGSPVEAYVIAEFLESGDALEAVRRLRDAGFRRIDLHSPYPVEGFESALGLHKSIVPWLALAGGLGGAGFGYVMQWWCQAVAWPMNIGGRPPHSIPSFIPITFELGVLGASLTIFFSLLLLWKFPQPYHPVFEDPAFRTASADAFWVSVQMHDPAVETPLLVNRFETLGAHRISRVEEPTPEMHALQTRVWKTEAP